jgi:hypothetical protein
MMMTVRLAPAGPATAQQPEGMTAAECASVFDDADSDGDGILSRQEITAADLDTDAGIGRAGFVAFLARGSRR